MAARVEGSPGVAGQACEDRGAPAARALGPTGALLAPIDANRAGYLKAVWPDVVGIRVRTGVAKPYKFIGFGAMDDTKPYKFIGFGALDVTKPYKFIRFGAMDVTKPYEFIWFGAIDGPRRSSPASRRREK